ncbi:hypothetical protein [Peribacillus simplex]|uniref:hypothetical protein n=1 Tax=Peribacillus simplex TaxID=1478 RepID=UPI0012DA0ECE|nr:hypothetical protein [Peribacillus simplex]
MHTKAFDPFIDIRMDEEYTSVLALEELPAAAESSIREALKDENEEPMIVEHTCSSTETIL